MGRNIFGKGCWLVIFLLVALALPSFAFGDETNQRRLALDYMALTNVREMMEGVFSQIKATTLEDVDLDYPGKSPEKDRVLIERLDRYLDGKLSWDRMKGGYASVYADEFSESELEELVRFYSSPVGKKVLAGNGEVQIKLLEATQYLLQDMFFEMKDIESGFIAEQMPAAE